MFVLTFSSNQLHRKVLAETRKEKVRLVDTRRAVPVGFEVFPNLSSFIFGFARDLVSDYVQAWNKVSNSDQAQVTYSVAEHAPLAVCGRH